MPFREMPGVTGLVYVPNDDGNAKKHNCPDCYNCQWCSDAKCELCLANKKNSCRRKCKKKGARKQ